MDLDEIKETLKAASKSRLQQDPYITNLVRTTIQNLPENYTQQVSESVFSCLFQLCRSSGKEGYHFVLQFVPTLIWIYLSAIARQSRQACGKLETILLAVYNSAYEKGEPQKSFRLPSLSQPSLYHEPSHIRAGSSALTEMALSRHEQNETPVFYPGPGRQLNRIAAVNRQAVLSVVLKQYNGNIIRMTQESHLSYCILALRATKCGFKDLCKPAQEKKTLPFDNEELAKLRHHPRIPLSPEIIHEITQGMYFLMYNGQGFLASNAVEVLDFRASHSLLSSAHLTITTAKQRLLNRMKETFQQLTRSIKQSLQYVGHVAHDRPLGLEVLQTDNQLSSIGPGKAQDPSGKEYSLAALLTDGMGIKQVDYTSKNVSGDIKGSQSDDSSPQEVGKKTHHKSHSLGHFKIPSLATKGDAELQCMPWTYTNTSPTSNKRSVSEKDLVVSRENSVARENCGQAEGHHF